MSCPYCNSDVEDMPIAAIVDYYCGTRYDDVQGEYYRSDECYENEIEYLKSIIDKGKD